MYNSRTLWWQKTTESQMVGGVQVSVPSNDDYVQQKPFSSRWSYSGKQITNVENGVTVSTTIDYKVFTKERTEITKGDVLEHPNSGDQYLVRTNIPIDGFRGVDHWEMEVTRLEVRRARRIVESDGEGEHGAS